MTHLTKRLFGPVLFVSILICFSYIAAQQQPTQPSRRTQGVASQPTQATPQQPNDQLRDQVAELQTQVRDLQSAIDDLKAGQQMTEAKTKETQEQLEGIRATQKQAVEKVDSLARTVGQHDRQIDELGRQIGSMMRDLSRVKTKMGLY